MAARLSLIARSARLALVLSLASCGGAAAPAPLSPEPTKAPSTSHLPAEIRAVVEAADRSADDKELDAGRKPGDLLLFAGIKPGMKVADLAAGGGYTSELLARAVGPSGVVYGQNSKWLLDRFAKAPWDARVAKPVNKNVVSVAREFDDPLPPEAKELDAVVMVLFYHDTIWMKTDRDKMNAAIFRALKSGGSYVIVDHSGRAGTGTKESDTLHRIEEAALRAEVERAGFKLAAEGSFLREPSDTRDWNAAPFAAGARRGKSDRFVLRYVKP